MSWPSCELPVEVLQGHACFTGLVVPACLWLAVLMWYVFIRDNKEGLCHMVLYTRTYQTNPMHISHQAP